MCVCVYEGERVGEGAGSEGESVCERERERLGGGECLLGTQLELHKEHDN